MGLFVLKGESYVPSGVRPVDERDIGFVVAWLREQGAGEVRWLCHREQRLFKGKWCDAGSGRHIDCRQVLVAALSPPAGDIQEGEE